MPPSQILALPADTALQHRAQDAVARQRDLEVLPLRVLRS